MTDRKVAVVTGAAKGIGRATAQALAGRSWNVVLLDVDEVGLRDAKRPVPQPGSMPSRRSARSMMMWRLMRSSAPRSCRSAAAI